jgi:nucleotide-binding universal stress UspA family protein
VNGTDGEAAWSVEVGHPADALAAAAKKAQAAMIVVGCRPIAEEEPDDVHGQEAATVKAGG